MEIEVTPGVILTRNDGQAFAIVVETGEIHELNDSGAELLDLCERASDVEGVVDGLAARYEDVGRDELTRDVKAAVVDFVARGILRPARPHP